MDSTDDEPNLYLRQQTTMSKDTEVEHNEWDDSKLVEAYDRAINKAKEQIVLKLKEELNLDEEDVNFILGSNSFGATSEHENMKKKKEKSMVNNKNLWKEGDFCRCTYSEDGVEYEARIIAVTDKKACRVKYIGYGNEEDVLLKDLSPSLGKHSMKAQEMAAIYNKASKKTVWREGDSCRCTYSEDGKEYEARIIAIFDRKSCRVKYMGYGNEENVLLKDLTPSLGKPAVEFQEIVAKFDMDSKEEGEISSESDKNELLSERECESSSYLYNPRSFQRPQRVPMFGNMVPPPTLPPIPPFSTFGDFNLKGAGISDNGLKGEAVESMLISWFMCGYYSGYCAAQQKK